MFSKASILSTLVLSAALGAHAIVTPSEPGPGSVYRAGSTCVVTWTGDNESTTIWKDMAIQLMTGSNYQMVHITTVATGQDGTVDGRFEYPCPEMDPYSAIYFYQFSSPLAPERTWTTRFTIASASGETTPPSNPTQPGTNAAIPWGTGNLADPSKAVPAPASAGGTGAAAPSSGTTVATSASSSSSSSIVTSVLSSASTTATKNATAPSATADSGAAAFAAGRGAIVGSVVALASVAVAFVL